MSIREEQCNKVCRILDDVLANRPTERDSLIIAVRKAFESLEQLGNSEPLPSAQTETYKEKLKEIADALSEKFAYMNTCLNERDIILGYLGVKRPSETHCNTDCTNIKCESYCYNKRLSSAQPEINTDEDTISRQAAIDAVSDACFELRGVFGRCEDAIKALPSTQFERKIGQWIFEERKRLVDETDDGAVYRTEKWWSCSECGYAKGYQTSKPSSNYCENCGAEMLKEGKE